MNADKLIYLAYPILIFCFFYKAKFSKKGEWNTEAFSLKQTKALQGFLALCIMFHHIGQKTCASWLPRNAIFFKPGLEIFVPTGFYFVVLFLFFSGYGLLKSFRVKPNYLNGFIKKRILPVVFTGYVVLIMYYIFRLIQKEPFSVTNLVLYLLQFKMCNVNGWFVIALPIFYLVFYFAFKYCKTENKALLITCLSIFVYCIIGTILDHSSYIMGGEWWYNSAYGFVLGLLFAKYEEKILTHVKKHFKLYITLSFLLLIPLLICTEIGRVFISYYGENGNPKTKIPKRWAMLSLETISSFSYVFFMLAFGLKCKIGNKILNFMGSLTLEFYLVHGLFVELFCYSFVSYLRPLYLFRNPALYVVVVFVISLPISILIKKCSSLIFSKK